MQLVTRHLAGIAFSALGTTLLTVALELILDPEPPAELVMRAVVALVAGLAVFVLGLIIAFIATVISKQGKCSTGWAVISVTSVPAGVALSLALSLLISAGAATVSETGAGAAITATGFALVVAGFFVGRGFWVGLGKRLLEAIKPPAPSDSASDSAEPASTQS